MEIWPSNQYGIETPGITSTYEDEKAEKERQTTFFQALFLSPGLNFINVIRTAFALADPKWAKKTVKLAVSFGAYGTYKCKSCT